MDGAEAREARAELSRVLGQRGDDLSPAQAELLIETLRDLTGDPDDRSIQNQERLKLLIRRLYAKRDLEGLLEAAFMMARLFPKQATPLEWICKVYLEWSCGTLAFDAPELEASAGMHVAILLELCPRSTPTATAC